MTTKDAAHSCDCPYCDGLAPATSKVLNEEEAWAWKAVSDAKKSIEELPGGLSCNRAELFQAIHTLQHFVLMHAMYRQDPGLIKDITAELALSGEEDPCTP